MRAKTNLSRKEFERKLLVWGCMVDLIGWKHINSMIAKDLRGNKRQRKKLAKKIGLRYALDDMGVYRVR